MRERIVRRFFEGVEWRSIRARLLLVVGGLLALGAFNVYVSYWGSRERDRGFEDLMRAIDRQSIITAVANRIEDKKKHVDLLSSGVAGESPVPSDAELERFEREVDSIPRRLEILERTSTSPGLRDSIAELRSRAQDLAHWWKTFYGNQGVDASASIIASVKAEPLAQELLGERLPAAVAAERLRVERASTEFVETDRTVWRISWLIFLASALIGGALAVVILRDVFGSIGELKEGAGRIGSGDLDHRVPIRNEDELGEVAHSFNRMADRLRERSEEIERQRRISEDLLLNILPSQIAEELREHGHVEPKYYSDATIVFTDIVGFTSLFERLSVDRMVRLLDELVTAFDRVIRRYGLEKLKTIGDAYMCVGGLTRETASHPVDAIMASRELVTVVRERGEAEGLPLSVRVGVHTGPVAAGVVGIDKFAFDVWGNSVNLAARLETSGEPDRINLSHSTWLRVKDFFACRERGTVTTKEGKEFNMYFLEGIHPELMREGSPPPPFAERYRIYFERELDAFPSRLSTVEQRPRASSGA